MSRRVLVFGNSGAGKSTLAKALSREGELEHLDLDGLAWSEGTPPRRRPLEDSQSEIRAFVERHPSWVIEGCYADLLGFAAQWATEALWLNLPTEVCVAHAQARPWEPHKYESKAAQDANLPMLLEWIRAYDSRQDEFSRTAHAELFASFPGSKQELTSEPPLG